ncbi:MAG: thioredoxin family protein [Deltaproteobacteria bacterium]|jgi:thiol-disulfide isomerase/thioredoxin|nr:thioredoxin family protein [Deltaproteobacteria bacterium]
MARISLILFMILLGLSCTEPESLEYDTPLRSDAAVRARLASACRESIERNRPLLLEFSAPWCTDCQLLHTMKQRGALARELARWPAVVVNVNQFDRNVELLAAFGVERIAHWAVLAPRDCDRPAETWPRLVQQTLEPKSGAERGTPPDEIARWLVALREGQTQGQLAESPPVPAQ